MAFTSIPLCVQHILHLAGVSHVPRFISSFVSLPCLCVPPNSLLSYWPFRSSLDQSEGALCKDLSLQCKQIFSNSSRGMKRWIEICLYCYFKWEGRECVYITGLAYTSKNSIYSSENGLIFFYILLFLIMNNLINDSFVHLFIVINSYPPLAMASFRFLMDPNLPNFMSS